MLFSGISLTMILASIPALIIAAAGHEFAHAKVADMLGDSTPSLYGAIDIESRGTSRSNWLYSLPYRWLWMG